MQAVEHGHVSETPDVGTRGGQQAAIGVGCGGSMGSMVRRQLRQQKREKPTADRLMELLAAIERRRM